MSLRFTSNIALVLAGVALVAGSLAFSASITGWVAMGIALGVLLLLWASELRASRAAVETALDGAVAVLAVWTVVASAVFSGATLTWLSFAEGVAFAALAHAGLVFHERSTEQVVHTLVAYAPARSGESERRSNAA